MHPKDKYIEEMCDKLIEGICLVAEAIAALKKDTGKAASASDRSRKSETLVAQIHREAIDVMCKQDDPLHLMHRKEVYDSLLIVASRIASVAEKLMQISQKKSF
jgi:uncharacterized protein Yka (UPF0111/DUF47 family)